MECVHGTKLDLRHAEALHRMFQRPIRTTEGDCNLCMGHTKKLKLHVSRHLEQLALFAIPRADYLADNEDDNANSNAAHVSIDKLDDKQSSAGDNRSDASTSSSTSGVSESPLNVAEQSNYADGEDDGSAIGSSEPAPDTDNFSWDFATKKFQIARLGQSEPPPIRIGASSTYIPTTEPGLDTVLYHPEHGEFMTSIFEGHFKLKQAVQEAETGAVISADSAGA